MFRGISLFEKLVIIFIKKNSQKICDICNGKGEFDVDAWTMFRDCYRCQGKGYIKLEKSERREDKINILLKENIFKKIKNSLHL